MDHTDAVGTRLPSWRKQKRIITKKIEIMIPFDATIAEPTDRLIARDGRKVLWWMVDPEAPNPARPVKVRLRNITRARYYPIDGRYEDEPSGSDLFFAEDDDTEGVRLNCMPDVIRAIRCAEKGDMQGVRMANKDKTKRLATRGGGMSVYDASLILNVTE
jgi:hypothetical protein